MIRAGWRSRAVRAGAGFILPFLLGAAGARAETWTNAAGHALEAVPVALDGAKVTLLHPSSETISLLMHSFPPEEQRRIRDYLGILEIPPLLQSAFRLAESQLETAQALFAEGRIDAQELASRRKEVRESFLQTCEGLSCSRQSEEVQKLLVHWGAP